MRFPILLAPAASLLLATASQAAHLARADVCNGHSELCAKSYGSVSFVGAHNSYAVGVDNLAANQDYDVTQQLTDGIRLLQLQAHKESAGIKLCHTSCSLFDGGLLSDYLGKVSAFMTANPNEVVTIVIVNIDNMPITDFAAVYESAGLNTMSYSPASASLAAADWPSLGEMIDKGTRLVTFVDNQADFASVPYLLDEFTNVWETAFDVTTTFDCEVNRGKGEPSTQLYMINHFLDRIILGNTPVPDVANANTTNAAQGDKSLGEHVNACTAQWSRAPNFLLVDFYEYGGGSVFQVAATINGVSYDSSSVPTPRSSSSASSTPGASGDDDAALALLPGAGAFSALFAALSCIALGATLVL